MKAERNRTVGIVSLVVLLWAGPSVAQLPPTNDVSDINESRQNTGGGTGALRVLADDLSKPGENNTAYGVLALGKNEGSGNTAVGQGALEDNVDGGANTAFGQVALRRNIGTKGITGRGSRNTAIGGDALEFNTTGKLNTALGSGALQMNNGDSNTALGTDALQLNRSGSNNIAIGDNAGKALTDGSHNIYIGTQPPTNTESGVMRLGNSSVLNRTFVAGIVGANVPPVSSGTAVVINNQGRLGIQPSSARYKQDIQPMGTRSQGLLQLRPVTFSYKGDVEGTQQYGLIAEEVVNVYPNLVTSGANGEVESVQYHQLIPMLVNELQQQRRQQDELKAQNAALAQWLERLEAVTRDTRKVH